MPKTDTSEADVLAACEKGEFQSVATQAERNDLRSAAAAQADLALYRKAAARLADQSAAVPIDIDQL